MTRTKKYEDLHIAVEFENIDCMLNDFDKWFYIKSHQQEIKKELRCKH